MPGALDGVRVLEFSQIAAGPYCGVNLSDLGADVIKVEPREGEHYRDVGAVVPREGKRFQSLNRGKRAIAIDLKHERGREAIQRLTPRFDVVIHNMRPGVPERLGIDYPTLAALHPALIYCEMSAYGSEGPRGRDAATDGAMTAYTGLMAVIGRMDDDGTPQYTRPPIVDYATGLTSAMAIASALFHRERSGKGQLIQASMLQTALSLLDYHVMQEPVSDAATRAGMLAEIEEVRERGGSYGEQIAIRERHRITEAGPPRLYYSSYQAKDGCIALGCLTPPTRTAVRAVLGVQDDSDSPDYDSTDPENERRFRLVEGAGRGDDAFAYRRGVDGALRGSRRAGLAGALPGGPAGRPAGAGARADVGRRARHHRTAARARADRADVGNADGRVRARAGLRRRHGRGAGGAWLQQRRDRLAARGRRDRLEPM